MNHINRLTRIENPHTDKLEEKGLGLYRGWNDDLANVLIELSKQPHIAQSTPNDTLSRFRNLPAARNWHDLGRRSVYTLQSDEIEGLIWYDVRPRRDIEADYTFAIRMYESSRGKKLAHGFMQAAHYDFAESKGNPTVWLDVDHGNPAARHLYDKFGYVADHQEGDRTVMVYRP